jgi:hypothetical protein
MDRFTPFQEVHLDTIIFKPSKYEEYSKGKLISQGYTNSYISIIECNGIVKTVLIDNDIVDKISTESEFDFCLTLEDRIQLTILPKKTNVEDILFQYMKHTIDYTREEKYFNSKDPIAVHIFTQNMIVIKMTFKMTNPERIIEFTI